jgi:hypothetical protein
MPHSPEALYLQLRLLVDEMPDLETGPITPEINKWLGRAIPLAEAVLDGADIVILKVAATNLNSPLRQKNAQAIATSVYMALTKAQMNAPAAMQDSFLPAGKPFDTMMTVEKVLGQAKSDILFIDPYADAKVLEEYALLAPEQIPIRLLCEERKYR